MQISAYLPIVLDILDNHPTLKESIPSRTLQCAYLCAGRIKAAQAEIEAANEGHHAIPTEILEELEEGTVLSYEVVGKLMHISNKRVRELIIDLITQVAIRHLETLRQAKEPAAE